VVGNVAATARAVAPTDEATLPPAVEALDAAVRGISGVLDVEQVLQVIVDRVRELVSAQYAALGIVDEAGVITEFITSGITPEQRAAIGDLPHGRGLLGLIIRENRGYRIAHISEHPESYGFPPNHPAMESFLGVPVSVKGDVVGRLYLTNKLGDAEFSATDQALVETFALHAGIAIENARLHEAVQRLAVVDERDRISRELHDSIIQMIYGVTLSLDDVPALVTEDPAEATRRVDKAIDTLNAVTRDIRQFIFGLRPILVDSGSLMAGLAALADEFRRNTATEIEIEGADPDGMPLATVADVLAVAREALSNVARHAGARHAWVRLSADPERITLAVEDDGVGIDPAVRVGRGHDGLSNMHARAEKLGGTFRIETRNGTGTRILVSVPRRSGRAGDST